MRWRDIIRVIGRLALSLGLTLTFVLIIGLYYWVNRLLSMILTIFIAILCGLFKYTGLNY